MNPHNNMYTYMYVFQPECLFAVYKGHNEASHSRFLHSGDISFQWDDVQCLLQRHNREDVY